MEREEHEGTDAACEDAPPSAAATLSPPPPPLQWLPALVRDDDGASDGEDDQPSMEGQAKQQTQGCDSSSSSSSSTSGSTSSDDSSEAEEDGDEGADVLAAAGAGRGGRGGRGRGRGHAMPARGRGRGRGGAPGRGGGRGGRGGGRSSEGPYWQVKAFPAPQTKRRPYKGWPAWDTLVQKLYVLDWEDSAEWYVPKSGDSNTELEREDKLEQVKKRRKHLKSLVLYNLVQGHIARAIPHKSRAYHFPCRVKKPKDDAGVDYIGMLPPEVLYFIISFLDPIVDLPRAGGVCRLWNAICSDPVFWVGPLHRRDIMGNTVLHLAASSIDEEVALRTCAYFIRRGAPVEVRNRSNHTPRDIASTLGHEALHLFLSRQTAQTAEPVRPKRGYWSYYQYEEEELLSFGAYSRVVKFIDSYMQDLQPAAPRPPALDQSRPGFWMHKHLPKSAFEFLRHTKEEWRNRQLDRWEVCVVRRRHLKAAVESAPAAQDDDAHDNAEGGAERPRSAAPVLHPVPESWWEKDQLPHPQRVRARERAERLLGRQRFAAPMYKRQPAPPPRVDSHAFPALPKRRGGRGGRGGRGANRAAVAATATPTSSSASAPTPSSTSTSSGTSSGTSNRGGQRGSRGRSAPRGRGESSTRGGGRGGRGRGRGRERGEADGDGGRKDKGKEKADD